MFVYLLVNYPNMRNPVLLLLTMFFFTTPIYAQNMFGGGGNPSYTKNKSKTAKRNNNYGNNPFWGFQFGLGVFSGYSEFLNYSNWDFRNNQRPAQPEVYDIVLDMKSLKSIDVGWNMNIVKFGFYKSIGIYAGAELGFGNADFDINNQTYTFKRTYYAIPIALNFRHGGDVTFDRARKLSYGFGAGLMPTLSHESVIGDNIKYNYLKSNLSSLPFMYAEIGQNIGWQAKLRLTYYPTGFSKYKVDNSEYLNNQLLNQSIVSYEGSDPMVKISILLMPFTNNWSSTKW